MKDEIKADGYDGYHNRFFNLIEVARLTIRYYPDGNWNGFPICMWIGDCEIAPTYRAFGTISEWKSFVKGVIIADRELDELLKDG